MTYKILDVQPTASNPCVVENYPYGFKRTQIRYWVESKKGKGDRFVSQTLNPKSGVWNKPKKGTYSCIVVVFQNLENNHIKSRDLSFSTCKEAYEGFIEWCNGNLRLNPIQEDNLKILRSYIKAYENVTYKVRTRQFRHKVTGEVTESVDIMEMSQYEEITDKEHEEEQIKIKSDINKLVAYNYAKDTGTI